MSKVPNIKDAVSSEFWEKKYPIDYTGMSPSLCVLIAQYTLRAVLRELESAGTVVTSGNTLVDGNYHFASMEKLRNRIRAALG